jgi:hypothetical protein
MGTGRERSSAPAHVTVDGVEQEPIGIELTSPQAAAVRLSSAQQPLTMMSTTHST